MAKTLADLVNFATSTAPAASNRSITVASDPATAFDRTATPQVVGTPRTSSRSFAPYGIPCNGPRHFPARISSSARFAAAKALFKPCFCPSTCTAWTLKVANFAATSFKKF